MGELTRDDLIGYLHEKRALRDLDLSDMDLRGLDFRRLNLEGSSLQASNLAACQMEGVVLRRCNLREANLSGAILAHADLRGSVLRKADLSDAALAESDLSGADLTDADLTRADLSRVRAVKTVFTGARLVEADLREAVLTDAQFDEAHLWRAMGHGAETQVGTAVPPPRRTEPPPPARPAATSRPPTLPPPLRPPAAPAPPRPQSAPSSGELSGGGQYHPPQKEIPCVIFTRAGWMRGVFHIPELHGFLDYLMRGGEFLKLTDVTLPYLQKRLGFFGIRREEALMIIPDCAEDMLKLPRAVGRSRNLLVHFLLTNGYIKGSVTLDAGVRISDFLLKGHPWVVLRTSVLGPNPKATLVPGAGARYPLVLLNTAAILGASEESLSD